MIGSLRTRQRVVPDTKKQPWPRTWVDGEFQGRGSKELHVWELQVLYCDCVVLYSDGQRQVSFFSFNFLTTLSRFNSYTIEFIHVKGTSQ